MTRRSAERGGRRAERLAAWWLRLHGWHILAMRARTPVGEVDLVARGSREHIEASLRERNLVRRGYHVRKGDDLEKIGKKFDLSDGDIARINAIPRDGTPTPGTILVVYVDKDHDKGTSDAPPPRAASPASDAAEVSNDAVRAVHPRHDAERR